MPAYDVTWLLPKGFYSIPIYTEVLWPILDAWVTFVMLVLLFVIGCRKGGGLWITEQTPSWSFVAAQQQHQPIQQYCCATTRKRYPVLPTTSDYARTKVVGRDGNGAAMGKSVPVDNHILRLSYYPQASMSLHLVPNTLFGAFKVPSVFKGTSFSRHPFNQLHSAVHSTNA